MKALLVIDVQQTHVTGGDFTAEINHMNDLIAQFKAHGCPVFFIKHTSFDRTDPFYHASDSAALSSALHRSPTDPVIEKQTPSAFYETTLQETFTKLGVDHLFITGFNSEFCCLFTAIAAYDRGYNVTFIEDATATVNNSDTYEMSGLDIRDFVATVLDWSGTMHVCDTEDIAKQLPL